MLPSVIHADRFTPLFRADADAPQTNHSGFCRFRRLPAVTVLIILSDLLSKACQCFHCILYIFSHGRV